MMFLLIGLATLLYVFYHMYEWFFSASDIDPDGKYVLISGCDTGVGHMLAIELDKQGFNVLATVYVHDNITLLRNKLSSKSDIFHLDITKQEDIDVTFELVQKKTNKLHALINNAGIITHGCIDWTPLDLMHKIMNVNFFGHVAMTKKFLPLLINKRDSRVVNMCSVTGFLAFPNISAYSASKYALESFSDCLRREMYPWGLRVSVIEPGPLRTTMMDGYVDGLKKLWHELSIEIQERWGIDFFNNVISGGVNSPFIKHADDPYKVVRAIQHAIINRNPRIRYRPDWQGKLLFTMYWLPASLIDRLLNVFYFIPADVRNQHSRM